MTYQHPVPCVNSALSFCHWSTQVCLRVHPYFFTFFIFERHQYIFFIIKNKKKSAGGTILNRSVARCESATRSSINKWAVLASCERQHRALFALFRLATLFFNCYILLLYIVIYSLARSWIPSFLVCSKRSVPLLGSCNGLGCIIFSWL